MTVGRKLAMHALNLDSHLRKLNIQRQSTCVSFPQNCDAVRNKGNALESLVVQQFEEALQLSEI
jgi:hypothetical protein